MFDSLGQTRLTFLAMTSMAPIRASQDQSYLPGPKKFSTNPRCNPPSTTDLPQHFTHFTDRVVTDQQYPPSFAEEISGLSRAATLPHRLRLLCVME